MAFLGGSVGYPLLFLLVASESAGAPVPGETALLTAGVLASQGRLELPSVIAVAAVAAIVGDNVGYVLGREGGRRLLVRPGRLRRARQELLERGERFFERHGGKAVFLARWLPGLRVVTAWLAGANRMHWARFAVWNALGGVAWACSVGVAAFLAGRAAGVVFRSVGLAAVGVVVLGAVGVLVWRRLRGARRLGVGTRGR